ncbi:MAG: DUF1830 domain-containing protein [Elainellaceae cyanobacterium]
MTQILNALPAETLDKILCSYHNRTPHLQIARITNVPHWYFERVVFPGDFLFFEAVPEAQLEIYSGDAVTSIRADRFSCQKLQIQI